ncbi:MAG: Ni/Fe-hydrogenase cytochrome b subunit [bacterium]|nr:Ni/Fe-hydrogenase cytochrome b subunit [bacterium]
MDRRSFFQTAATMGATCVAGGPLFASETRGDSGDAFGVLTDVSQCIGCRKCEWACNESNHLPTQTLASFEEKEVFDLFRRPDGGHYTVVNKTDPPEGSEKPVFVKYQCFHCDEPACYSACLVTAFTKTETGAVIYDPDRCMGCRYCMVACPFQIPAYQYNEPLAPKVQKCNLCYDRIKDGGVPACVEVCPPQCLTFGKKKDLLTLAHGKIGAEPDQYVNKVYGEHEAGGTSWLYVSNKPFEELHLPTVAAVAPSLRTEKMQHGIFRWFVPPAALFGVLGLIMSLGKPEEEDGAEEAPVKNHNPSQAHHHPDPEPVAKPFFTPGVLLLIAIALVGAGAAAYRFIFGIGAATNLSDQFPWGIWIAIDVATGVALAAGGFTTAALVHIFHQEKYHPLVRPALLTAVLGYTFVVIGLTADLGRYYNVWHPMMPWMWSGHSVLFEVGMCVSFYLTVLYIEFLPIAVERFKGRVALPGPLKALNGLAETLLSIADATLPKVMWIFIIAGVMLSCMHQSSLGALMVIAPGKVHPLWYTPVLPLLFLLSAFAVGFPMVVFESMWASKSLGRKPEMELLAPLSKIAAVLLAVYLAFKIGDLVIRDAVPLLWNGSAESNWFLVELIGGVVLPFVMLCTRTVRKSPALLFTAAALIVGGVMLNRINVFLTAFHPVYETQRYFPSLMEIAVTAGLISTLVLMYRLAVTVFPVLPAPEKQQG